VRSQRRAYSDSSAEESIGWMQEAAAAAAAAAAVVPQRVAGRPVLYVTAEESDQQVCVCAAVLYSVRQGGCIGALVVCMSKCCQQPHVLVRWWCACPSAVSSHMYWCVGGVHVQVLSAAT
jgi:hypothetical protein